MKAKDKVLFGLGLTAGVLIVAASIIASLYYLATLAGEVGARVWAVVATLALPVAIIITYRLATHSAREHLAGLDRGLTHTVKTVETMGRSLSAASSLARMQAKAKPTAQDLDSLLPKVGAMRLIDTPTNDELIDL